MHSHAPGPRRRRGRPARGPAPRTLSRDVIVDAALQVLDSEGLDAITMRRVAEQLDTGPASLYAHVEHKDDLVAAVFDRVLGEVDLGEDADPERWQEQLKQMMRELRATLGRHRDIARASLGTIPTGDHALPAFERMLSILRAGGVSDQVAAWTADILSLYVTATAYEESLETWRYDEAQGTGAEHHHAELDAFFAAQDPGRFPTVVAMAGALTTGDGEQRFEFGLDMIVRGIASTVQQRPRRRR